MHYYKLDNKLQDQQFLGGDSIRCQAAFTERDISSGITQAGTRIIIMLSNGAKYMARVVDFHTDVSKNIREGWLEIVRENKS